MIRPPAASTRGCAANCAAVAWLFCEFHASLTTQFTPSWSRVPAHRYHRLPHRDRSEANARNVRHLFAYSSTVGTGIEWLARHMPLINSRLILETECDEHGGGTAIKTVFGFVPHSAAEVRGVELLRRSRLVGPALAAAQGRLRVHQIAQAEKVRGLTLLSVSASSPSVLRTS